MIKKFSEIREIKLYVELNMYDLGIYKYKNSFYETKPTYEWINQTNQPNNLHELVFQTPSDEIIDHRVTGRTVCLKEYREEMSFYKSLRDLSLWWKK